MKHIVLLSGGAGSWAAGKRVAERYGTNDLILLFTDTKFEDEDTYRYLRESAANIGGELVMAADGRDIWEVFIDEKFMGNSRVDVCSKNLKRLVGDRWIRQRYKPDECIMYVGIDFTEEHRYTTLRERKLPYVYEAPLLWEPLLTKAEVFKWSVAEGLKQQRLYDLGMPHANCGGGCVKAGQAHWKKLYEVWPERYKLWEEKEQEVYKKVPNAKPFLKRQKNKVKIYMSLKEFRETILEAGKELDDPLDFGGCGCFVDAPEGEE